MPLKRKNKNCIRGYCCGYSCIATSKSCLNTLNGQAKNYAKWLADKVASGQLDSLSDHHKLNVSQRENEAMRQRMRQLEEMLLAAKAPQTPKPGSIAEVSPDDIAADPKRFQYKIIGEHTQSGEVGSLTGVKKWDPNLGGIIQAYYDPDDGKTYVVNGHNRLALAKRLGAEEVTIRYLDVKSDAEARAVGALTNIAEGRGTALDAARFFRDSGISREDLESKGIPMQEQIASHGINVSRLDDSLFRRTIDGDMPIQRAALIGGSGLDNKQQRDLVALIDKQRSINNDTISELIDTVRSSQSQAQTTLSLFGNDTQMVSDALERASLQAAIKRRLNREQRLFTTVGQSRTAQELQSVQGNQINVDASKQVAQQAAQAIRVFDTLKNVSGPVGSLVSEGARRIQNGEDAKKVQADIYEQIMEEIASGKQL